jgi:hypothetical protein
MYQLQIVHVLQGLTLAKGTLTMQPAKQTTPGKHVNICILLAASTLTMCLWLDHTLRATNTGSIGPICSPRPGREWYTQPY